MIDLEWQGQILVREMSFVQVSGNPRAFLINLESKVSVRLVSE